ncbi:OmpA family protein [Falsirhodobacter xinxiangensis]|uniref:OmpA family protein n=1 Tax=Falsirhodobacter xinxiangensis TaxID=2530049 RepID=UPI0010AA05D5|nr:OmpA family protein [Rhodobacter xinxiangensis]
MKHLIAALSLSVMPALAFAQAEQEPLSISFPTGAAAVPAEGLDTLDEAARLFRAGNPIVMIVTGGADTVGNAGRNLQLSVARAQAVADGLVARGIPADRLQVLGRGTTELPVDTSAGVAEQANRVVEISWR